MDGVRRDIQYAIRNLLRRPGFLGIAVITLALGIGGTTAIFSTVHALLVRPLSFPNLERVVAVWEAQPSRGVERNEASMANYLDWRAQNQTFEHLGESRSTGGVEIRVGIPGLWSLVFGLWYKAQSPFDHWRRL